MTSASDRRFAIIAGKVKSKREESGRSQETLAQSAGGSEDTGYRFEQGKYIQLYNLLCILDALGLELTVIWDIPIIPQKSPRTTAGRFLTIVGVK